MLVKSENMSPAFKIILQPVTEDDESSGMYDIGLETNTILRNAVKLKPSMSLEINVFIRAYMYGKVEIIYIYHSSRLYNWESAFTIF